MRNIKKMIAVGTMMVTMIAGSMPVMAKDANSVTADAINATLKTYNFTTYDNREITVDAYNIIEQIKDSEPVESLYYISKDAEQIAPGLIKYMEDENYIYVADPVNEMLTVAAKAPILSMSTQNCKIDFNARTFRGFYMEDGSVQLSYQGDSAGSDVIIVKDSDASSLEEAFNDIASSYELNEADRVGVKIGDATGIGVAHIGSRFGTYVFAFENNGKYATVEIIIHIDSREQQTQELTYALVTTMYTLRFE